MRDFSDDLQDLRRRLGEAEGYLKIVACRARLSELEFEISRPDLWDDQDAAKKRDEVAARLDQKQLTTARLAVQNFNPEPEPDEAINLKTPPGGWDRPAVAGAKPKPRAP